MWDLRLLFHQDPDLGIAIEGDVFVPPRRKIRRMSSRVLRSRLQSDEMDKSDFER